MNDRNHQLIQTQNSKRGRKSSTEVNNRLVTIKKSTTATAKKGRMNSLVTESIQMSSSLPNLDNTSMFTHRYATRHRKNNSILAVN